MAGMLKPLWLAKIVRSFAATTAMAIGPWPMPFLPGIALGGRESHPPVEMIAAELPPRGSCVQNLEFYRARQGWLQEQQLLLPSHDWTDILAANALMVSYWTHADNATNDLCSPDFRRRHFHELLKLRDEMEAAER